MSNTSTAYHLPPDDYPAPTAACCERLPTYVPINGGRKWVHLTGNPDPLGWPYFDVAAIEWRQSGDPEHEVVLNARWFDTFTGDWHEPDDVFVRSAASGETT